MCKTILAPLAALALVMLQGQPGVAQAKGSDHGAFAQPAPEANASVSQKNYFALRHVASLQRLLTSNPDQLPMEWLLAGVRSEVSRLAKTYRQEKIAPEILLMVEDLAGLAERYQRLLADCKLIDERFAARLANDKPELPWQLLVLGAGQLASEGVKSLAEDVDDLGVKVLAAAVGFGIEKLLNYLREQWRDGRISAERYEELIAAIGAFQRTVNEDYERHLKLVSSLCERYGWARSQVGFDAAPDEVAPFRLPMTDPGNIDARLRSLKAWVDRRPNDPFAALDYGRLAGRQLINQRPEGKTALENNAAHLLTFAGWLRVKARNIPPGKAYDPARLVLLREAGHLANNGALRHNVAKVERRYGTACKQASLAVECWEECLRLVDDDDGFYRMRHAFAIALSGDLREAKRRAEQIADLRKAKNCPIFAQNYAALCSQLGETAEAIEWVEIACRNGGLIVSRLQSDPELTEVRRAFPGRIASLAQERKTK